ncbi:hypothetical protein ACFU99_01645 [Streptomyces sp. NPDC057654]|uniref:hypothetical protein n=1 Tax=Streptomyces sp. NPDC057654 TaxID=3346196 RepID=UPI0036C8A8BD
MNTPFVPVRPLEDRVWLVAGFDEAQQVLADARTFRTAQADEYVPGYSRSFFLATDTGTAGDRTRFRSALAAALSPQNLAALTSHVMTPLARRLAGQLPDHTPFHVPDAYVRPYTRQLSYALAGLDPGTAVELAGRLRVATELLASGDRAAALTLLHTVRTTVRNVAETGGLDPRGLPGFAIQRGFITAREAPLLTIPLLEMAALDMSGALTQAALHTTAQLPPARQRHLATPEGALNTAAHTARHLPDIYVTRVATRPARLAGTALRPGDRILIDIPAANTDPRRPPPSRHPCPGTAPDHLAFGHGAHLCRGRPLALHTAATALHQLLARGTLTATAHADTLVLHP